ncbi:MAG: hypothetical protein KIT77_25945 [Caldilinea sp.]|nr:hypothetical protein [Caldilinea sp.]MCB0051652.1 hypothetical protein [Caldilinea sp.]MCB0152542.1 hypothetical protein [Caldilineaceae bacterium]MCW5844721.1 hypothetical protein [Caldilinea sp.]
MTKDYWSWLETVDLPATGVPDLVAANLNDRRDFRAAQIGSQLKRDADALAFHRLFERLALLYRHFEASDTQAAEGTGTVKVKDRVKGVYTSLLADGYSIPRQVGDLAATLNLVSPAVDLKMLPQHSVLWSFTFTMQSEYVSRDDAGLYAIDNPVRKEIVFKLPMVASTSWKGALRSAYRQTHAVDDAAADVIRLFGTALDDDTGEAGALHFFSTFFDRMGVMVINPHDRATGIGAKGPILFEVVPPGSEASFNLLYVPKHGSTIEHVCAALTRVSAAIEAMFTLYGFGAKTSSGSGTARSYLKDGKLSVKASLPVVNSGGNAAPQEAEPAADLPRYLEAPDLLSADFRAPDGSLKSEEEYQRVVQGQGKKYKKEDRWLYEKARKWYERRQQELAAPEPAAEEPVAELPPVTELSFASFEDLTRAAAALADSLRKEGGA